MPSLMKKAKKFYKKHLRGGRPEPVQHAQPANVMADMAADTEASEDLPTLSSLSAQDAGSSEGSDISMSSLWDDSSDISMSPLWDESLALGASSAEESDEWERTVPESAPSERGNLLSGARASAKPAKYDQLASVGDMYQGEHDEAQWRYDMGQGKSNFSKVMTTAFDDADRDAHRVEVDEAGRLMQGGEALDTTGGRGGRGSSEEDTYIFAMGAEGDLQAADQQGEFEQGLARSREAVVWAREFEAQHGQPPTPEQAEAEWGKDAQALKFMHHSSFFAGEDVAGAGELKVDEGRVKHITPNSGHYKPGLEQTTNVTNELADKGADLSSALVDVSRLDDTGKAETDSKGGLVGETFHSGEILAAQGHYGALMGKKDMLAQLKHVSPDTDVDSGPAMSEFDLTEELEEMYLDDGATFEECEIFARNHGFKLLRFQNDFAFVEELAGGGNLSRGILDNIVGEERESVEPAPREFAPELGRVLEAENSGYSGYNVADVFDFDL